MKLHKIALGLAFFFVLLVPFSLSLTIESVSLIPEAVVPGGIVQLTIEIENEADYDAQDIKIALDLSSQDIPFAPVSSAAQRTIREIEERESETVDFNLAIFSDADPKTYKIPLVISYQDEDGVEHSFSTMIGIPVSAEPNLNLFVEGSQLIYGRESEITVKLVNSGLADMKFLAIQVQESGSYKLLSPSRIYIGSLDSDDTDTAEFKIIPNIENNIAFPVTVSYLDENNNVYTATSVLNVRVYSEEDAAGLGLVKKSWTYEVLFIVLLAVVCFIIFRLRRKK
ncbi:hypothetical protein HZB88_00485 [archaeon]|nr:hypothetical protein [archaeon]